MPTKTQTSKTGQPKIGQSSKGTLTGFLSTSRKAVALVVVVLIVAIVVAHVASGKAGAWRRAAASDQSQAAQDQLAYQVGESARLHAASLRRSIAAAAAAIPAGEDQQSLVASLSGLASGCGASWSSSSWSAAPGTALAGATAWTVQVSFSGTDGAVLCTVRGLPTMARAVGVTDIDLTYEPGNQIQANASLDVYGTVGAGK